MQAHIHKPSSSKQDKQNARALKYLYIPVNGPDAKHLTQDYTKGYCGPVASVDNKDGGQGIQCMRQ